MRPDDPSLVVLRPPTLTWYEKTYIPQILTGLGVTARHIGGVMFGDQAITVQYPEEQHVPTANYRGVHRLNKDEDGRIKCVACMLCATACPVHCIDIVGATAPDGWDDREKYPESFVIDELRCIFCGMCEEACPVDAIELTGLYDLTGNTREEMIYDKAKLLSVFDMTKDAEPMKTGNPPDAVIGRANRTLPLPTIDPAPAAAYVANPKEAADDVQPSALEHDGHARAHGLDANEHTFPHQAGH